MFDAGVRYLKLQTHPLAAEGFWPRWCRGMIGSHEGDRRGTTGSSEQDEPTRLEHDFEPEPPLIEFTALCHAWGHDDWIEALEAHRSLSAGWNVSAFGRGRQGDEALESLVSSGHGRRDAGQGVSAARGGGDGG